jgi:hypothetical protein
MSGYILNFLICCRDLNLKFKLFSIDADVSHLNARNCSTDCCVSVLGCISIDGPCFVRKFYGPNLDARTYIKHLSHLSESLVVWEPKEKRWRFAQDGKREYCGGVRLWFDSQTSLNRLLQYTDTVLTILSCYLMRHH